MAKKKKDDEMFRHQISYTDDQKVWALTIDCDIRISPEEFGAACISLGRDIINGKSVLDDAVTVENCEDVQ